MGFNLLRKVNRKRNSWLQQKQARDIEAFIGRLAIAEPIVVLGNQKTGSTAIAALLAEATAQSVTLDLQRAIQDVGWQLCVKYGVTNFGEVAYRYKEDFSRTIIKEPSLTYFYDEMVGLMPKAKFVFIQRNPYQNIRSILNRLKIPGNLHDIEYDDWSELQETPVWRLALDSSWLGRPRGTYIEGMAHRWDAAARTYLDAKDDFISIRYEEFTQNKKLAIENLAHQLGLKVQKDISASVDVQHQPKGNLDISPSEFFGERNCEIIRDICAGSASQLGYEL
ncbi:sulfotransferase [Marinobacter sp. TBZ242]|uniref:Sulfotransferase n=1 Tax=Marinobacter azerbaijanicus TaxID=3050455 RepID=A0ABT7IFQ3_9GAMM|nr:sulfotransferase [Marinobacter sp. TBZ242]MDL0431988.1 sulfotransferase [Marinobacter sp. TBZ242]